MALKVGELYYDCTLDTRKLVDGEREASRRLDGVGREFDRLQTRATKVAAAIGAALAAIAVDGLISKLVTAQRQFDVMFASLKTVTGGAQAANEQFDRLREFAATTPYSLEQAVQGFVKLKALGLDPSERAMRSFGNTSAAMGKNLNQMIEAVADASTSEFERLKEFGIKARQEGDQVSFTFQGVTTTIGNNSAEIVEYLTQIGEVNFGGAMSERMKTLDGDISNLQDSLQGLYLSVSRSGFGDAIAAGVRKATQAIQEAEASVKQGSLTEYFDRLRPIIVAAELAVVSLAGAVAGRLVQSLIAAGVQAYATAAAMGAATVAARTFTAVLAALGGPIGIAITGLALLALNWDKITGSAKSAAEVSEQAAARIAAALAKRPSAATSELQSMLKEAEGALASLDEQIKKGSVRSIYGDRAPVIGRDKLNELQAQRSQILQTVAEIRQAIASVGVQGGRGNIIPPLVRPADPANAPPPPSPSPAPRPTDSTDAIGNAERDFEARVDAWWRANEEALDRAEERAAEKTREDAARLSDRQASGRALAADTLAGDDPIARLQVELDRKRELLDQYAAIDQEQSQLYADAKVALEQDTARRINEVIERQKADQQAMQSAHLQNYSALFGGIADLTKAFAGKQSAAYKVLFAASKAFAIADSIIKIQQGIANASALPFPASLGAMASVVSATAGIISTIKGTSYGGGRQYGGPTSAGTLYKVNEAGRPEMFTAANGAQYMLPTSNGRVTAADQVGGGNRIEVRVHNYAGADVQVSQRDDGRIIDIAVNRAKAELADDLIERRGVVWGALAGTTNLRGAF